MGFSSLGLSGKGSNTEGRTASVDSSGSFLTISTGSGTTVVAGCSTNSDLTSNIAPAHDNKFVLHFQLIHPMWLLLPIKNKCHRLVKERALPWRSSVGGLAGMVVGVTTWLVDGLFAAMGAAVARGVGRAGCAGNEWLATTGGFLAATLVIQYEVHMSYKAMNSWQY